MPKLKTGEKIQIVVTPETHPRLFELLWKIQERIKLQQAQAQVADQK